MPAASDMEVAKACRRSLLLPSRLRSEACSAFAMSAGHSKMLTFRSHQCFTRRCRAPHFLQQEGNQPDRRRAQGEGGGRGGGAGGVLINMQGRSLKTNNPSHLCLRRDGARQVFTDQADIGGGGEKRGRETNQNVWVTGTLSIAAKSYHDLLVKICMNGSRSRGVGYRVSLY